MNLYQRLCNLIKRGVITLVLGDTGTYARAQAGFFGRVKTVEVVFPYGLYANAPKGASVLLFDVNGQEENMAGIAYDALSRFKNLAEGEVVIGNPKTGSYAKFSQDGKIAINSVSDVDIIAGGVANITSSGAATITCTNCTIAASGTIALGSGGMAVARVGDAVAVDPSTHIGTITAGSTKVTSV